MIAVRPLVLTLGTLVALTACGIGTDETPNAVEIPADLREKLSGSA